MNRIPVITVDGPSGVGKGMVTRWLAQRTGFHRLDSGALYRILALAAANSVDLDNHAAVAALASGLKIEFVGTSEDDEAILVGGQDWTREVRAETTGALASRIAVSPEVRAALLQRQKDFRVAPGLIADGRDMGTVVFTDARLKLFLDASPEERADRRLKQLSKAGIAANFATLCEEIRARDARDRSRSVAPLKPADDAYLIDTTGLSPEAVLAKVEALSVAAGF
ncbi:MAG: (d)CMP kinase [Stagnimonas sp.]|nr:(d)CMP kinase [Stagnimonas sp.]